VGLSAAYPNPVRDRSVFVKVDLSSSCPVNAHWSILTAAYRMVTGGDVLVSGKTTLTWDQKDLRGRLVSNGLYYFILRDSSGGLKKTRILVLR
jgi:hypothetical protein